MVKSTTLDQLGIGQQGIVQEIECTSAELRTKLLCFGIVPGRLIEVQHFAPLGDPMMIRCSNSSLALRLSEARCVSISVL